jgi:hypothetical protein
MFFVRRDQSLHTSGFTNHVYDKLLRYRLEICEGEKVDNKTLMIKRREMTWENIFLIKLKVFKYEKIQKKYIE